VIDQRRTAKSLRETTQLTWRNGFPRQIDKCDGCSALLEVAQRFLGCARIAPTEKLDLYAGLRQG
jgi:hypothetical protein